jgi:hypothetical protein
MKEHVALRRLMRVPCAAALLVAAVAGCGQDVPAAPAGSPAAIVSPTPTATDPACPRALVPGIRASAHVADAVFANLHRIFPDYDVRGTSIDAVLDLRFDEILPAIRTTKLRNGPALRACGRHVMNRSWGALVGVPLAPNADVGTAFVYVVRTAKGWQPWYVWLPNASSKGTIISTVG